jgi:diadenosine tetraphosphate (Ap4A) HIT family hydrolase/predicted house-cleaning noncanonical NTP pyrophosphatase (MazG superfamily)
MPLKRFRVEKLIRDHLPEIMHTHGVTVHHRLMNDEEFIARLKDKILEEAEEVKQASNAKEMIEELADLLEVVYALALATGTSLDKIEQQRMEKRKAKGGFDRKVYHYHTDIPEDHPFIHYYLEKPEKYPPIEASKHHSDCLFCQMALQKRPADIVASFTHCFVIKDQFPVSKGHLLIIPYEHTDNWFTAREEVRAEMMKALDLLKSRLDSEYHPDGYNVGLNCGKAAGQTVMHLHLHLIPRYQGDMPNPRGGVRGVIPSQQKYE